MGPKKKSYVKRQNNIKKALAVKASFNRNKENIGVQCSVNNALLASVPHAVVPRTALSEQFQAGYHGNIRGASVNKSEGSVVTAPTMVSDANHDTKPRGSTSSEDPLTTPVIMRDQEVPHYINNNLNRYAQS